MTNELLENLEKLHTTELGVVRIKQNLGLKTDVVSWCKEKILSAEEKSIFRKGKNWYIKTDSFTITVNACSYTVITAHKEKNKNV